VEDKTIVSLVVIVGIIFLETINIIFLGIDGSVLAGIVGSLCLIVGYFFGHKNTTGQKPSGGIP